LCVNTVNFINLKVEYKEKTTQLTQKIIEIKTFYSPNNYSLVDKIGRNTIKWNENWIFEVKNGRTKI